MKVLVADKFEDVGLQALRTAGIDIDYRPSLSASDLGSAIATSQPDVLVVRSTQVSAVALTSSRTLKLVVRAGAGYDTIDVPAASADGISVANCPGKNAVAVAELAWGLILSCDRRIPEQTHELREGRWNKRDFANAQGLRGRTLGVIGLGPIGQAVIERARGFDMRILGWSRSLTPERAEQLEIEAAASLIDLARASDVVTLHLAATPETEGIIDGSFIAAMKSGAILINTSRGQLVSEPDLIKGMAEKGIRAGLDVFVGEPKAATAEVDLALARVPGVVTTHHVGASTDEAQMAIAMETVKIILTFRQTGAVLNSVNRAVDSSATCLLTVRHRNRPGVLAHVFQVLSEAHINVEEMDNILYDGALAASARIQLDQPPSSSDLDRIRISCPDILGAEVTQLAVGPPTPIG